jgi:hypothetical protein
MFDRFEVDREPREVVRPDQRAKLFKELSRLNVQPSAELDVQSPSFRKPSNWSEGLRRARQ